MFVALKRKLIVVVLLLALVGCFGAYTLNRAETAEVFFGRTNRKLPVYCVDVDSPKIAITFDAAWGGDKTREIMKILKDYEAAATFFLVGFWVDKFPDIVGEIDQNGFEIGTHSSMHLHMSKLSKIEMLQDLQLSVDKITAITDKPVKVFRPPFGEYNDALIETSAELGLTAIQWSVDSLDWKGISANEIAGRITSRIHNGAIILCHNNSDHITEALPVVLAALKAKGYTFTTVSELIYTEDYYIDHTGKQFRNTAI